MGWGVHTVIQAAPAVQGSSPAAAQGVALSSCTPRVCAPRDLRAPALQEGDPYAAPGVLRFPDQPRRANLYTSFSDLAAVPASTVLVGSNRLPSTEPLQVGAAGSPSRR